MPSLATDTLGTSIAQASLAAQEAVPFDPTVIAGLSSWLDATSGVATSGSNVNSWTPSNGSDLTAFDSSGTNRPSLIASDANFGGRPSVDFDGSNDYLRRARATSGDYTVVMLARTPDYTQSVQTVYCAGYETGDPDRVGVQFCALPQAANPGTLRLTTEGANILSVDAALRIPDATPFFYSFRLQSTGGSSANAFIRYGGNEETLAIATTYDSGMSHEAVGSQLRANAYSQPFFGQVTHLLKYDAVLTDSEIDQLETYLLATAGL